MVLTHLLAGILCYMRTADTQVCLLAQPIERTEQIMSYWD